MDSVRRLAAASNNPYQNLSFDPASCVFHYAFECFEGMKAYKDSHGQIRLFRPDKNMERLNKSSARIAWRHTDIIEVQILSILGYSGAR